jgi:hypothetical protein
MSQLKELKIVECRESNSDFVELFNIFVPCLKPDMTFREFRAFYASPVLEYIDASLVMEDGRAIGFCAAAFYHAVLDGRHIIIARAAVGMLEAYRGGNKLPVWALFNKFIRYRRLHPLYRIMLTGYIANPIVYSLICRYAGIVYPKANQDVPARMMAFKESLLERNNLKKGEIRPFVLKIPMQVKEVFRDMERIWKSKDPYVQFHCSQVFAEDAGKGELGLLVLVPVSWWNVFLFYKNYICTRFVKVLRAGKV